MYGKWYSFDRVIKFTHNLLHKVKNCQCKHKFRRYYLFIYLQIKSSITSVLSCLIVLSIEWQINWITLNKNWRSRYVTDLWYVTLTNSCCFVIVSTTHRRRTKNTTTMRVHQTAYSPPVHFTLLSNKLKTLLNKLWMYVYKYFHFLLYYS